MINKEVRFLNADIEIREIGKEKDVHIQGYALNFDTISEDLGFRETIKKGALANADLSNVVLNFNHDMSKPLARNTKNTGKGSLVLKVDEKGLFFDAIPTNTTYARDLIENMKEGILGKCSFAFALDYEDSNSQSWDWDNGNRGYDLRTINKIAKIFDVSIVTNPAYESTSSTVYSRAKDNAIKEKQLEENKRKLSIELELI